MSRIHILAALTLPLVLASGAAAGEMYMLEQKVFGAERIVELRLPLDAPIPGRWPNQAYDPQGWAFPDELAQRAVASATVVRVPKGAAPPAVPERPLVFSAASPCWWKAHARGSLRTLVFLDADGRQSLFGVEHDLGLYSDLNPAYEQLVAAIEQAAAWPEERMRAVAPGMLWQAQREVLRSSDEPYLLRLTLEFLRRHDAADAIDEEWGPPGSEPRARREKQAAALPVESVCRP